MIRALFFVAKVALLVAAAVWVANRPGAVEIHWLGYDIRAQIGLVLLALFFAIAAIVLMYRVLWEVLAMPKYWRRYRAQRKRDKGYRALTLGLTAVAAGDVKLAGYQAFRARRLLPQDMGLPMLLEAQAARLKGDDATAHEAFGRLLENKDTAFLGLRGLLLTALDSGDTQLAGNLAQRALALHPRQPWVLHMSYDIALRQRHWDEAQKILARAERSGAVEPVRALSDRTALLLQQAEDDYQAGHTGAALAKLKKAHSLNPSFVPAALRLAQLHIEQSHPRQAVPVLERTWKENPHPEMVALWREAMPRKAANDGSERMRWFERLVALRPDSVESQIAAAGEALDQKLWGPARQYLDQGESIRQSTRLYRLRARLAQAQNRLEETGLMLRKGADAPPDKLWICTQTGRIYDHWAPVAMPHGSFNTIVWDYPRLPASDGALAADRTELLITAPAAA